MPSGFPKNGVNKGWFKKGASGFRGTHTEETRRKIRLARARQGSNVWNKGTNLSGMLGKRHRKETIEKMCYAQLGEKNNQWMGGTTKLRVSIWHLFKYRQWRSDIFSRDNFTCVLCLVRGGRLEADHHPKRFIEIIRENKIKSNVDALNCEELWNLNNGRTLCKDCHLKTETYGNRKQKN